MNRDMDRYRKLNQDEIEKTIEEDHRQSVLEANLLKPENQP